MTRSKAEKNDTVFSYELRIRLRHSIGMARRSVLTEYKCPLSLAKGFYVDILHSLRNGCYRVHKAA